MIPIYDVLVGRRAGITCGTKHPNKMLHLFNSLGTCNEVRVFVMKIKFTRQLVNHIGNRFS